MSRDTHGTESMFDVPTVTKPAPESQRTANKPVGFAGCPRCISHDRVPLQRTGSHMIYKLHDYTTWSGAKMECQASGQRLCDLKPKPIRGRWSEAKTNVFTCPCGR